MHTVVHWRVCLCYIPELRQNWLILKAREKWNSTQQKETGKSSLEAEYSLFTCAREGWDNFIPFTIKFYYKS